MEEAAKRFARWVLFIHVLLLAGVATLVVFAAREVYRNARQQALDQAARRQTLLAEQTARGIESYYSTIIDNFELLRRAEEEPASPTQATLPDPRLLAMPPAVRMAFAPALWSQLKNRASHFLILDRSSLRCLAAFPDRSPAELAQVIRPTASWLRQVSQPSLSKLIKVDGQDANLVCVPVRGVEAWRLFVAVVPMKNIEQQFLRAVNEQSLMSIMVLDENAVVMAAFNPALIGRSMILDTPDSRLSALARRYTSGSEPGIEVFETPINIGGQQLDGGIVNIEPIRLRGGGRWWLTLGSSLKEVDAVVRTTFRRALVWAIFVIVTMTAVLVSTAIQMIRSRIRMERIRHDLLTRELDQARQIQLAWLPKNDDDPPFIDLAALNKPASHISGDFYNWFELCDGRTCVVIGDVTGHGMAAAFLMATTQLLVRMIMPRVMDPGRCMEEVNRQLCQQVFSGQFVTMQILLLDRINGRIEIATGGHPPPLIGQGAEFKPLELESQLVLGVEKDSEYPTQSFDLPSGASLVLYTDGVIEAQAPDGPRFTIEGLCNCLYGRFDSAQSIIDVVIAAVARFCQSRELADDLTLVTVQLEPIHQRQSRLATAGTA